jgi:hypothetical protein
MTTNNDKSMIKMTTNNPVMFDNDKERNKETNKNIPLKSSNHSIIANTGTTNTRNKFVGSNIV